MDKRYVFGIDMGGTTVKIGLFDRKGKLEESYEIPTDKSSGGENIMDDISAVLGKVLSGRSASFCDVAGIGMGIPGPVLDDGTVLGCVNVGWGEFNAAEKLSSLCGGAFVRCGNDADVAALGEMLSGAGQGHKNMVMVTLGTGVGGGVIINGDIVSGAFGAAGEIGHITVEDDETDICGCGRHGCLEQYASATGIVRMAKKRLAGGDEETMLRDIPDLTAKDIFGAASGGDRVSLELVDALGRYLGKALSCISCVADPEIYVIGGGVSGAGDILLNAVKKHYREAAFGASRGTKFAIAQLGNKAGMYGAAWLALRSAAQQQ